MRRLIPLLVLAGCAEARADHSDAKGAKGGAAVLATYCAKCHGDPEHAESDFGFVRDTDKLISAGYIVPGDAERSLIYRRIALGEMPPAAVKKRPKPADVAAVKVWIDGMEVAAAPVRTAAEIDRLLAADYAALDRDDRDNARWLTLTNLASAGVPVRELDRTRTALAELLASLTWAPAPRAPVSVDAEGTIVRIDLRELGWTAATWDAIRAAYPYGVARGDGVPDTIRADWFVATASQPPLYQAILGLPDSEAGLARLLGVDLAADLAAEEVTRAGFAKSGVSINNRVIERHATRYGALWRSYDFKSSVGAENIFEHPLDFVPSGGELIFNLPDGLQAYFLVNATGDRLDKAPTTIVSDPRRPDRAVTNGLSCMGCHASGIVDHADELRAVAGKFSTEDRDRIRALHPVADELAGVYAVDRQRFVDALATTIGATPPADPADEPITAVTARYESELDLVTAAAELGVTPEQLTKRVVRSEAVSQALAGITDAGGTVKRDAWVAVFARAVTDLGIGVPFTPTSSLDLGPAVWIDRDRHTWIALAQTADQRGAVAACRRRRLELPGADALIAATNQGITAALGLGSELWTAGVKLDASNQRYAAVIDPAAATSRRVAIGERHSVVCVQQ